MKKHLVFLLTIFLISSQISLANTPNISGEEIIGTVNGENLTLTEYKRLVSSQRKTFHKKLDFDIFSKNAESLKKREEQLKKAKDEGLSIDHDEFSSAWEDLLKEKNGINNLEKAGKEKKLLLVDIQRKLEDNLLLDKYFDKHIKEKLLQVMIDELIILQEAKARGLEVPEELVIKKLEIIEDKQGGEEAFRKFLAENNATIEDAKQEVKNQFLYEFIKEDVAKELHTNNKEKIKSYFKNKKEESEIIVYDENIPGPKVTLVKLVNDSSKKLKDQNKKEDLDVGETKIPASEISVSEKTKVSKEINKEINDEIETVEEKIVEINKDLQKKKESKDIVHKSSINEILKKKEAEAAKKAELALLEKQKKEEAEAAKKAELALLEKQKEEAEAAKKAELALLEKQKEEAEAAKKAELALLEKQKEEAEATKKAELALAKKQEKDAEQIKKTELVLLEKQKEEAEATKKAELALAKKQEKDAEQIKKTELVLLEKQKEVAEAAKKAELALLEKQKEAAEVTKKAELALVKKQEKDAEQIKKAELALAKKQEKEAAKAKKVELALAKKQEELNNKKEEKERKTLISSFDSLDKKMEEKRKIALKRKIDKYALVKAKEKQKEKLDQVVPGQPIVIEQVQPALQASTLTPSSEQTFDISKELMELRKKLEERRVTTK